MSTRTLMKTRPLLPPARIARARRPAATTGWRNVRSLSLSIVAAALIALGAHPIAGPQEKPALIDATVTRFLDQHRHSWRDMNVPDADGRALYDLVVEERLTSGRSRSARRPATRASTSRWGLSKTGGKLITIDIDEGRHREAIGHFKEAGVAAVRRRAAGRRARPGAEARRAVRLRVHRRRQGVVHQLREGGPAEAGRGRTAHRAQRVAIRRPPADDRRLLRVDQEPAEPRDALQRRGDGQPEEVVALRRA